MKQCPTCRRTYDDTTVFCKECGVALGNPINPVQANPSSAYVQNPAYVQSAPAMNAVPMNEYKEWTLNGTFHAMGVFEGKIETTIKANGPIMNIEQQKRVIITYGKRQATVDARDITDVHVKKKTETAGYILIFMGVFFLIAPILGAVLLDAELTGSDITAGLIPGLLSILIGYFGFTNKHYIITHRRGSFNLPFNGLDSAQRQDFLDYITRYSPYAVKTDLSLGW